MTIKILGIHGLGGHPDEAWMRDWTNAVRSVVPSDDLEFDFVQYDRLFADVDISPDEALGSAIDLLFSGITSPFRRPRGFGKLPDFLRFTAGYVAAWLRDEEFQQKTRQLILDHVSNFQPTVILAHSLGSLLAYDALAHKDARRATLAAALQDARFVTLGSQIGNGLVVGNLMQGRIVRLPVHRWVHLYNEMDRVFTAPISLPGADNFLQLRTTFDARDGLNHRAPMYLAHSATASGLWRTLVRGEDRLPTRIFGTRGLVAAEPADETREPVRKALLVGINDYPSPEQRLEGCINDVYTMSAVLQECGFKPEEIRLCLNERATKIAIEERLHWLLDDAREGDECVFYFSGHGAQMTEYGTTKEPDRHVEALVPWDFDWSTGKAVSDELIHGLYSQLSFGTRFTMIIDCCHAAGMHRDGGRRPRGIAPPDDIRHRELQWDLETAMWVSRGLRNIGGTKPDTRFFGEDGSTVKLGRSAFVRSQMGPKPAKKSKGKEVGPYLPLIIESCGEAELSYEYRHGATSYGAFTFCLASILREEEHVSFQKLVELTGKRLAELGYKQTPQILAPKSILGMEVPWDTGGARRRQRERALREVPGGSTPQMSG